MFSEFLSAGFNLIPKTSLVFPGGAVAGVWNDARYADNKDLGGFEPDNEAVFTVTTSLVANPAALIGRTVTKDGAAWRILRVRTGATFTSFTLVSDFKA
ncbi:hypothetical protein [Haloferula sp. BvORR071]|uniref:hypothetical protein n=1 Tax=Haloferula sp. BvORR071 TaxID=1396141 RepID=UPI0005509C42|nr:hypothetical protein [Haloferula sp. BvORR071]